MALKRITSAVPGIGTAKVSVLNAAGYHTAYDVLREHRPWKTPWEDLRGIGERLWGELVQWARAQEPDASYLSIISTHKKTVEPYRVRQRELNRERTDLLDDVEAQLVGYVHGVARPISEPDLLEGQAEPQQWFRLAPDGYLTFWVSVILAFYAGSYAIDFAPTFDGVPPLIIKITASVLGWLVGYLFLYTVIHMLVENMNDRLDRRLGLAQRQCVEENRRRGAINEQRIESYEAEVHAARNEIWAREDVKRTWGHFRRIRQHHEGSEHTWTQELECFRGSGQHLGLAEEHVLNMIFPKMIRRLLESSGASMELSSEIRHLEAKLDEQKRKLGID